jgi:signal transduction histidine kinase
VKQLQGDDVKVVFIGPCVAKKREALSHTVAGDVAAVLTFLELREMLDERGISPESVEPSDVDPPRAGKGALFPIRRGMLEAARLDQGLTAGNVVAADGRLEVFEAIAEFERGCLGSKMLEVLACQGCIMGAGMTTTAPLFSRQATVAQYVRDRLQSFDEAGWRADMELFADLDLRRSFTALDQRLAAPTEDQILEIMARMGKVRREDELNCGACGYESCREHARAIHSGLAESEMCLPYTIEHLRRAVSQLALSHEELANTQEALMHAEKLASMGQLAAGIAHEVNNPLGVVLMYAHLLLDECAADSRQRPDLLMIAEQADRCKRIVSGLLNFARQNKAVMQPVFLRDVIERALQGLSPPTGVTVRTFHSGDSMAELDRDQIAQVVVNLVNNAFDAMPSGGELTVLTKGEPGSVSLQVVDTGTGISPQNLGKLFEPFFTTKPMGKGTGLGLPVVYGIVKMHRGDVKVESNTDQAKGPLGSTFTITLPRRAEAA